MTLADPPPPSRLRIDVVIPAFNEQDSVGQVIRALPKERVRQVVVADNNSTDATARVAGDAGAVVVPAPRQGYGSACLAALAHLETMPAHEQPDIVAFIDADFSDHPEQLPLLVEPILSGNAEFVVGSRMLKPQPKGALLPQAVFGNKLACFLMWLLWRVRHTDLGPFRAISWPALRSLRMSDPNYGWTVEMQIKAARAKLRTQEVAVDYRPRIGQSKITGTISGTFRAGYKILWTIIRYGILQR
jgi:glycosyltransferase involved in cell wall biosynthesis